MPTFNLRPFRPSNFQRLGIAALGWCAPWLAHAAIPVCEARSGQQRTPVIELYTSEGCSSCPPADQWLSALKGKPAVVQAFHVGYWDYIGWVDRFASPAYTSRQRELASTNQLRSIYTPQVVRDGLDWPGWNSYLRSTPSALAAGASIDLQRSAAAASDTEQFVAQVSPAPGVKSWSAYWTITEHSHSSRVKAGENKGENLQHDFVVRQYTPVGRYQGPQTLRFAAPPAQAEHARQINLVVHDPQTHIPLQAISLQCAGGG
ncbi:MAG: hypothetical protein CFE43_00535 [Burkholderiales bacterium PBB3]|nr:MAG: hypothetical protein CFE43_00535 [Burkholderiales bacterium PBB3]